MPRRRIGAREVVRAVFKDMQAKEAKAKSIPDLKAQLEALDLKAQLLELRRERLEGKLREAEKAKAEVEKAKRTN
jgi:chaperonin cofactor prefoldin